MKNKLTRWFVYEWGKPIRQKSHQVILRSPLPRIHYYHNKRLQVKESQYPIPTYSWTFTPTLNWTCSIVTVSLCNVRLPIRDLSIRYADPNTRLTHQLEKDADCKVLQFIIQWKLRNSLVTKLYGVQTQQFLQEKNWKTEFHKHR